MTLFTQWFPDPRFVHLSDWTVGGGGSLTRWASARGIDLTTKAASFAHTTSTQSPVFEAPAGQALNLVATVQVSAGATPNLSWSCLLMLHDGSKPASDGSAIVAKISQVSDDHQTVRFTVPASGKLRLQCVAPKEQGGQLKVSELSIVSDAGLAWMRDNNQWWIHHALMPLQRS